MNASSAEELENSIRLALEAAEAANDTAGEVSKLSADTRGAAARLDGFARQMKPAMLGLTAGAVVSMALGGLVYFRTLSELRSTSATQIEALTLFSKSVADLQAEVAALHDMSDQVAALGPAQEAGLSRIETALSEQEKRLDGQLKTAQAGTAPDPMTAQMLQGLAEAIRKTHQETRDAFTAGLSDLQLALTRMLADGAKPAASAQAPAPAPAAPPRATAARAPRTPPAANPFKYP